MKKKLLKKYVYAIVGLSLWITIGFVIAILVNLCKNYNTATWSYMGQLGDFFGGIVGTLVAIIGFILIYLSFKSQTKSQEEQEKQFLKSQIESRFFELVKLHKENLNDIIYSPDDETFLTGRKAVDFIYEQIEQCYKELQPFFEYRTAGEIYNESYFKKIHPYSMIRHNICLANLAKLDIVYSIIFFGTSHSDIQALNRILIKFYNAEFLRTIFRYISLKPLTKDLRKHWDYVQKQNLSLDIIDDYFDNPKPLTTEKIFYQIYDHTTALNILSSPDKVDKYYGGHQYKLGHYFRHLFQTVKYIDEKDILTYNEKYDYIKTLRAQLSTIEQYVFFFNSVSFMGRAWEFENIVNASDNDENEINKWLISKYNLIKNIPDLYPFEDVLLINNYYPEIDYEFEEPSKTRKKILKQYWEN